MTVWCPAGTPVMRKRAVFIDGRAETGILHDHIGADRGTIAFDEDDAADDPGRLLPPQRRMPAQRYRKTKNQKGSDHCVFMGRTV